MRVVLLMISAGLLMVEWGGYIKPAGTTIMASAPKEVATSSSEKQPVDFDTQVKPIFKSKCMPCHFEGGQMYDRLPFDRPATIRKLGNRLFTRIKEKEDQQLIENFLTQTP